MNLTISLVIQPMDIEAFPDVIPHKGCDIKVLQFHEGILSLELHEDLTVRDHIRAVEDILTDGYTVSKMSPPSMPEKLPEVELTLTSSDLTSMTPLGKPIWESVFKKPGPVSNIHEWYTSPQSDQYVYLPNNLRRSGDGAEDYVSNAMYTEVLVNAYRVMCKKLGISPVAQLTNGSLVACATAQPSHGAQATVSGEKAARLANSTLVEFDDSVYAKEFIQSIIELEPYYYESETVKRKVLSKVESILMGKSSHTYNQRLIQKLLDTVRTSHPEILISILTGMVMDGFVLEESLEEFQSRVLRTTLAGEIDDLTAQLEACRVQ